MYTYISYRENKVPGGLAMQYIVHNLNLQFECMMYLLVGDFKRNDDIYEELERQDLAQEFEPSQSRKMRTIHEMADECLVLRGLFASERTSP